MSLAAGPASVEALRGKKIAGPMGTVLNQLLVAALASKGMTLADVQYLNMDLPAARAALLAGSIDAATLAGANALTVEKAGGKVIASGKGLIEPTTVVATRRSFLTKYPDLVQKFLAAHREAVDFTRTHRDEALRLAAEDQKITIDDAKRQIDWYDFSPTLTDKDVANLDADQSFMLENKMIQKRIDIRKDLIDPMAFKK
jgi:sulfonate transport system substrate-binding protein